MKNKIVEAKKKKQKKMKGNLYAMGNAIGNRVTGKILSPEGEKGKMPY